MNERRRRLADYYPPLNICVRWYLSADDRSVKKIVQRLEQTRQTWHPIRKQLLLTAVEQIAIAEQTKAAWNPHRSRLSLLPRR